MKRPAHRVVVVGGGVTGLTTAHRLRHADPGLRVTLVEASGRLGGKLVTERVDGFVLEGGPDALVGFKPAGLALAEELGLTPRLVPADPGSAATFLADGDRLRRMPDGFTGFVPRRLWPMVTTPLLSPGAKLRLGLEWAVPAGGPGDESVADFVSRRLGRQFYQRLVEPLVAGIFGADPAELSLRETLPQLRRAEQAHGSLTRFVLAERRRAAGAAGPAVSSLLAPVGGMAELVTALEGALAGVDVRTSTTVESVTAEPGGYRVGLAAADGTRSDLPADAVVLAVPAPVAARAVRTLDAALPPVLDQLRYGSTVTVNLGFAGDAPPVGGHGYLVPARERRAARAVTWSSVKFPGRAPAGHLLARVSLGGPGRSVGQADREDLVALARDELARIGLTAAPVLARVHDWRGVMPSYTVGHSDRVAEIESVLARHPGLFVAGSAFHGAAVPDCIVSAGRAADAVVAHLSRTGPPITGTSARVV